MFTLMEQASKQENNENYFLLHLLNQQLDVLNSVSVSAFAHLKVFLWKWHHWLVRIPCFASQ